MRYLNKSRLTSLMIGLALFAGGTHSALALGTASGDDVNNTATLDYKVGTVDQDQILSSPDGLTPTGVATTFKVDNKVDLTVALVSDATVAPGAADQVLVFSVTNTGNTTQGYSLTATPTAGTDDFDADTGTNPVRIYLDVNNDGLLDGGDTLYVAGTNIADLTATEPTATTDTMQILVVADMPLTATDGQTAIYDLTATTLNAGTTTVTTATVGADTAAVDTVFADAQGTTDGATPDGIHSAAGTYTVNSATLTIAKTVTLVDDGLGGNFAIPGATVTYTIVVSNTGGTAATSVVISDAIPLNTTYVAGSITLDGVVQTDAADAPGTDDSTFTAGTLPSKGAVAVNVATLAASATSTITFKVIID